MLLGSESWDSTKTPRQDRSAKSGSKISERGFLWHRDPSERHRTGSEKKSGVARPRFTAPGGSNRRKLQNLLGKTFQRKPTSHWTQLSTSAAPVPPHQQKQRLSQLPKREIFTHPSHDTPASSINTFVYNSGKPNTTVIIGL